MPAVASRVPSAPTDHRPRARALRNRLFEPGRATLDARVSLSWKRLVEEGSADCLVCGTEAQAGRECPGCGSELS